MSLDTIWNAYQANDFSRSLENSLEVLTGASGIDMLHIAGLSLMNLRRQDEALTLLKAAATLRPQSAHIYTNAAYLAEQAGLHDDVSYFTDRGLVDFPDDVDLLLLKANNHVMRVEFDDAETIYRQLLMRYPSHIQSLINLGNICRAKDRFKQAEQLFDQAAKIDPDYRDLKFARATMYSQQGNDVAAQKVLEPIAHDIDAQFLLSLIYLSRGDYERGFRMYRARIHSTWYRHGSYVYPLKPFDHWSEVTGKDIAIIQEGGLGDLIQYVRYIPKLAEVAKSITLYVPESMMRLLCILPVTLKSSAYDLQFDYITTDGELPYHFRTTWDTVPNSVPYLFVSEQDIAEHILPSSEFKIPKRVGLCWAGGERGALNQRNYDHRRSIDLAQLAPLSQIRGIEFVSLQFGPRADENGMDVIRVIEPSFDFLDTAAVIAQLDLVISVDTSVVHLAAAMGKPTWLLSRYDHCWRWRDNRQSAWYPDVRIFGQKAYRDWSAPLEELQAALAEWARL